MTNWNASCLPMSIGNIHFFPFHKAMWWMIQNYRVANVKKQCMLLTHFKQILGVKIMTKNIWYRKKDVSLGWLKERWVRMAVSTWGWCKRVSLASSLKTWLKSYMTYMTNQLINHHPKLQWWKKNSCTSWYGNIYPMIYDGLLYMPGGCLEFPWISINSIMFPTKLDWNHN